MIFDIKGENEKVFTNILEYIDKFLRLRNCV